MIDPQAPAAFSAALFALGIFGVLVRRSVVSVLLSLELMFAASVVALISFDRQLVLENPKDHVGGKEEAAKEQRATEKAQFDERVHI